MKRGRPLTLSDEDLLAAAHSVFLEQGLDATTAEVARRAAISESVIFHRFKTKEALFLAVIERQAKLAPELEDLDGLVGEGELDQQLYRLAMMLTEKMRAMLPFFLLAFSSPIKLTSLHQRLRQIHLAYLRPLIRYFEAEARIGRLRPVGAETLANTFFAGVREYVFREIFTGDPESSPASDAEYVRAMIDVLLRGAAQPTPADG